MSDDDITQEFPIPSFEDDGGLVPPAPTDEEYLFEASLDAPLNDDELRELGYILLNWPR